MYLVSHHAYVSLLISVSHRPLVFPASEAGLPKGEKRINDINTQEMVFSHDH